MCWPTAASTSCRTVRKLSLPGSPARDKQDPDNRVLGSQIPLSPTAENLAPGSPVRANKARENLVGAALLESVNPLYFATGCHGAADGGDSACGDSQLHAVAGFRVAASRLSDHPDIDVL